MIRRRNFIRLSIVVFGLAAVLLSGLGRQLWRLWFHSRDTFVSSLSTGAQDTEVVYTLAQELREAEFASPSTQWQNPASYRKQLQQRYQKQAIHTETWTLSEIEARLWDRLN